MLHFKHILILSATLVYCSASCFAQENSKLLRGRVISVEDGNTLVVSVDDNKLRVRLIGVDVPSQALNKKARENLSALVRGKDVSVHLAPAEVQEGKHKLAVGKVSVGELDVGLEQIRSGFAWRTKEFEKYQAQSDASLYSEAEKSTVEAKLGVWGEGFVECKDAPVKTVVGAGAKPRPTEASLPDVYGTAVVEVTVDAGGNVVSARALCGHPVLQTVAVRTALRARYQPQSGITTGKMVYNFVPDNSPSPP